jgi:hypothetical protein
MIVVDDDPDYEDPADAEQREGMTVAELIADLLKAPQDAQVVIHTGATVDGLTELATAPGWAVCRARPNGEGLYLLDDAGTVDVVIL